MATIMPSRSFEKKLRSSSPRTPRYSVRWASSAVAAADSFRMAEQRWPTVAANVCAGCVASARRSVPLSVPTCRKKSLITM